MGNNVMRYRNFDINQMSVRRMYVLIATLCVLCYELATCNAACNTRGCYDCDQNGRCNVPCNEGYIGDACDSCIPGYYWQKGYCYKCQQNCVTCTGDSTCDSCIPGYFWHEDYKDCVKCPTGCATCTNHTKCNTCIDGQYGQYCRRTCPAGCNKCEKYDGKCSIECESKHYGNECKPCPSGCLNGNCNAYGVCTDECNDNLYGNYCNKTCASGCDGGRCNYHDGSCSCNTGYTGAHCESCIEGYYMNDSNTCQACPIGCVTCIDKHQCDECEHGKYGENCQNHCRVECINTECYDNGTCTKGCLDDYYDQMCDKYCPRGCLKCTRDYGQCIECKAKHYGDECKPCSPGCSYNTCNSRDGSCSCTSGYRGDKCDSCTDGHYLYASRKTCLPCRGECKTCTSWNQCDKCIDGKYRENCQSHCPSTCYNKKCNKIGVCTNGCENGYYGNLCHINCTSGCLKCNIDSGLCIQCKVNHYGDECKPCPPGCSYTCNSRNGSCSCKTGYRGDKCDSCTDGYYWDGPYIACRLCRRKCKTCKRWNQCDKCNDGRYGEICQGHCPSSCNNKECNKTGVCTNGCVNGYYGAYCRNQCNTKCKNKICNEYGSCTKGCYNGYHGNKCNLQCSHGCYKCDRYSDQCIECETGYYNYGHKCKLCPLGCLKRPGKSRCNQTDGFCSFGCEKGFYGGHCESECGDTCVNKTCSQTTGECTHGCKEGFAGCFCTQASDQSEGPGYTGTTVGVSLGVVLLLIILATAIVIGFVVRKRKRNKADDVDQSSEGQRDTNSGRGGDGPVYHKKTESVTFDIANVVMNKPKRTKQKQNTKFTGSHHHSEGGAGNSGVNDALLQEVARPSGDTYYNAAAITRTRVTVDNLAEYVRNRSRDDLVDEFKKLG